MTTKNKKPEEKATKDAALCAVEQCQDKAPCRVFTLQGKENDGLGETTGLCLNHFNQFNKKATTTLQQGQKWWLKDFLKEVKS